MTDKDQILIWETERYRLVDISTRRPPAVLDHERIVSVAAYPMGIIYLIEKGTPP